MQTSWRRWILATGFPYTDLEKDSFTAQGDYRDRNFIEADSLFWRAWPMPRDLESTMTNPCMAGYSSSSVHRFSGHRTRPKSLALIRKPESPLHLRMHAQKSDDVLSGVLQRKIQESVYYVDQWSKTNIQGTRNLCREHWFWWWTDRRSVLLKR